MITKLPSLLQLSAKKWRRRWAGRGSSWPLTPLGFSPWARYRYWPRKFILSTVPKIWLVHLQEYLVCCCHAWHVQEMDTNRKFPRLRSYGMFSHKYRDIIILYLLLVVLRLGGKWRMARENNYQIVVSSFLLSLFLNKDRFVDPSLAFFDRPIFILVFIF